MSLPKNFGPDHKDWGTPSKMNEYYCKNLPKPEYQNTAIFTMVSGSYRWYAPLFVYQAQKAYPENDIIIYFDDDILVPKELMGGAFTRRVDSGVKRKCGYSTAALRFLWDDTLLRSYNGVLITDIDLMHYKENPCMEIQRGTVLLRDQLECYGNIPSKKSDNMIQFPGVHWVTSDWWDKTGEQRDIERRVLENTAPYKDYDELMLGRIIRKSGLNISNNVNTGWEHGTHLGRIRNNFKSQLVPRPRNADEQQHVISMLDDEEFMELVAICSLKEREIGKIFKLYRESIK